ncbi:transmembrane protein 170A [Cimex lectularius]|uniref:Transmembrane protein 170A n=1 Tax=Cimex lectularius TaxID=79782 RepID=A0A8I6RE46_CIMLE|nr:transmembrane protein 170A [Cimex lectularius]
MSSDGDSNSIPTDNNWKLYDIIIGLTTSTPLVTFLAMWYQIFLWALFSSLLVHAIAAIIAFATLRKHHFGKFFPVVIVVMGVGGPLTSGVLSSGAIAFVYRASSLQMTPLHACFWGIGQTIVGAAIGFTRVLATL